MDTFNVLTMLGGLCPFLFGMNVMGQALERRAGGKLRSLPEYLPPLGIEMWMPTRTRMKNKVRDKQGRLCYIVGVNFERGDFYVRIYPNTCLSQ